MESRRLKRPLQDALIGVQFMPFLWALTYDIRSAAFDVHLGPLYISLVWPECLRLSNDEMR